MGTGGRRKEEAQTKRKISEKSLAHETHEAKERPAKRASQDTGREPDTLQPENKKTKEETVKPVNETESSSSACLEGVEPIWSRATKYGRWVVPAGLPGVVEAQSICV